MGGTFEELIAEASEVDVAGWDFSWLDGRATEERPPWGYQKLMGEKIGRAARSGEPARQGRDRGRR